MLYPCFALFDRKSRLYAAESVLYRNASQLTRSFVSFLTKPEAKTSPYYQSHSDFEVLQVAEYDDETGEYRPLPHKLVVTMSELVARANQLTLPLDQVASPPVEIPNPKTFKVAE